MTSTPEPSTATVDAAAGQRAAVRRRVDAARQPADDHRRRAPRDRRRDARRPRARKATPRARSDDRDDRLRRKSVRAGRAPRAAAADRRSPRAPAGTRHRSTAAGRYVRRSRARPRRSRDRESHDEPVGVCRASALRRAGRTAAGADSPARSRSGDVAHPRDRQERQTKRARAGSAKTEEVMAAPQVAGPDLSTSIIACAGDRTPVRGHVRTMFVSRQRRFAWRKRPVFASPASGTCACCFSLGRL